LEDNKEGLHTCFVVQQHIKTLEVRCRDFFLANSFTFTLSTALTVQILLLIQPNVLSPLIVAVDVAQYSVDHINRQQDFPGALLAFDQRGGDTLANTTMRELFRRHGVENILGLQPLHKHNKLDAGEVMNDVCGTSNPVTFDLGATPSIWGFDPAVQQLVPLEYSLGAASVAWNAPNMQGFLKAFYEVIVREGVDDIFGLSLYPGDGYPGRVEFSVGRSNVNLTPDEVWSLRCISKGSRHE
jgi:hypothetical protein